MPDVVVKEVRHKEQPLEDWKDRNPSPARKLVEGMTKEELERMIPQEQEFTIQVDVSDEAKVLVSDLSSKYGIPGAFILVFSDRSGRRHPYLTKEAMGIILERKGYSRVDYRKGEKHDPGNQKFHYVCEITPILTDGQIRGLELLRQVDRDEFLKEYRKLSRPIEDDGFASPDTVRMKTMRTEYNLERLAKTRAYRHAASLYTGVGFGVIRAVEEQAEEAEEAGVTLTQKEKL